MPCQPARALQSAHCASAFPRPPSADRGAVDPTQPADRSRFTDHPRAQA